MKRIKSIPFFFLTLFLIHFAGGTHLSFAAFSTSDLTGTWYGHELYTGEWAGWEHSTLTFTTPGNFSVLWEDSEGESNTTPETGTLNISNMGILTLEGSATFHGAVSSDKNLTAMTETWDTEGDGDHGLMVFLKNESGVTFSGPDLSGIWYGYSLVSGGGDPEGWEGWEVATMTIESTGAFTLLYMDSEGEEGTDSGGSGTIQISEQGIITVSTTEVHGAMSSDKNIVVLTDTWDPKEYALTILVKSGGTFSQSDLKGKWYGHTLTSGAWEGWMVSTGRVSSTGAYSATYTDSGGGSGTDAGTLNIDTSGKITVTGSSTANGAMSSDKNIIVITETPDTGVYSMMILVKGVPIYNPALPLLLLGD